MKKVFVYELCYYSITVLCSCFLERGVVSDDDCCKSTGEVESMQTTCFL